MCRRPPLGVDVETVLISAVRRRPQLRRTVCARDARDAHTAPDAGLDVGWLNVSVRR
ncbi:hypothetical protein EXIGLDRAFT_735962 [Exidia glandulosa HHB12029]|uniref:Uncharacterized protein n=1 Tax=Exidia glandulosa HHB12029 TaxID=1314781 RepID=A0A166NCR4_EXIGL|nr:hypothetical protein EXIGLDRAFT_735962 [Exidia glandulosa HHB12029]